MRDLTIMCVSRVDDHATPFLVAMEVMAQDLDAEFLLAADGPEALMLARRFRARVIGVQTRGFLESVHDAVIDEVQTEFVLRLDDDEKASAAMFRWLHDRQYLAADHWKFPRANLWTPDTVITSPGLWPDFQTRLSVKTKAKGRNCIHAGSPFGGGCIAPVAIEHYKFVVKDYEERLRIAQVYDREMQGAGTGGMRMFSLPEDVFENMKLERWGNGSVCIE